MSHSVSHKSVENKHVKCYVNSVPMYAVLRDLLLLLCSEGMGAQRNEDVICRCMYLYISINCITYTLDFT